jgi:LAS superfamily LD-carboxypeptidase LdcB
VAVAVLVGLIVLAMSLPGEAGLKEELEELREQQEQVQADKAERASQVDAATAEIGDLTVALEVLTAEVNQQATEVAAAEEALAAAEARRVEATEAVEAQKQAIVDLEQLVQERAITSFVKQNNTPAPILEEVDPNQAVRMQSLVESVTDNDIDVGEELRMAKVDLDLEQEAATSAEEEAVELRAQLAEDLAALEESRAAQQNLVVAAEERLEAQLAEAAALADLDQQLANEISKKNEELAAQAAAASRQGSGSGSSGGSIPDLPSSGEIVEVRGIWVHQSIADNLDRMLAAAEADGHSFTGGGYRDPQAQIRLRRAHCGTSNYAIYEMPSSQCSPPTARPGRSNHERGLAVDFRHNGSTITSRSNAGFLWLKAHAAEYGFYNLPSEPWHWSVNGN